VRQSAAVGRTARAVEIGANVHAPRVGVTEDIVQSLLEDEIDGLTPLHVDVAIRDVLWNVETIADMYVLAESNGEPADRPV
jgi:hypothetical protein